MRKSLPDHHSFRRIPAVLAALLLGGCAVIVENPVVQTLGVAIRQSQVVSKQGLDPRFRYLRVVVAEREILLASVPTAGEGGDVTWYSGLGEVVRLRDGRLAGSVGAAIEWRQVELPELPSWQSLLEQQQELRWQRRRDVMPGYRYGIVDKMVLRPIAPPQHSWLREVDPNALTWFEETVEGGDLPPARYAIASLDGRAAAIYGEFCLDVSLCVAWQQWPSQSSATTTSP